MSELNDAIVDLQMRIAYQEDTIAQLNEVVAQQDKSLLLLQQQMKLLLERFESLNYSQEPSGTNLVDERPPHY